MNDDFELRYYDLTRERYGFSYDINTLLESGAVVFANILYNQYEEDEIRFKNEYGKEWKFALDKHLYDQSIKNDKKAA